jgi:hypothetical protein
MIEIAKRENVHDSVRQPPTLEALLSTGRER